MHIGDRHHGNQSVGGLSSQTPLVDRTPYFLNLKPYFLNPKPLKK